MIAPCQCPLPRRWWSRRVGQPGPWARRGRNSHEWGARTAAVRAKTADSAARSTRRSGAPFRTTGSRPRPFPWSDGEQEGVVRTDIRSRTVRRWVRRCLWRGGRTAGMLCCRSYGAHPETRSGGRSESPSAWLPRAVPCVLQDAARCVVLWLRQHCPLFLPARDKYGMERSRAVPNQTLFFDGDTQRVRFVRHRNCSAFGAKKEAG